MPILSIVVVAYNMTRELPRTLRSLTPEYQGLTLQGNEGDYEVIVVDNGSSPPFDPKQMPPTDIFRYHYIGNASSSPAHALNLGARLARGQMLGFLVDGARLLSPGVIRYVLAAFKAFENAVVAVPGWHLGPDLQQISISQGYNQHVEDELLDRIDWISDGYRLFEISAPASSAPRGCILPMAESNAIFLSRETFVMIGRFDERFDLPGGGLLNLDFYCRALLALGTEFVVLPGEGTFHQVHGGVSTNIGQAENVSKWDEWDRQYEKLTGSRYRLVDRDPVILGRVPKQALEYLGRSANQAYEQIKTREAI